MDNQISIGCLPDFDPKHPALKEFIAFKRLELEPIPIPIFNEAGVVDESRFDMYQFEPVPIPMFGDAEYSEPTSVSNFEHASITSFEPASVSNFEHASISMMNNELNSPLQSAQNIKKIIQFETTLRLFIKEYIFREY